MKAAIDMNIFDSHIHTNNSTDASQTIDEVCTAAIERGLSAISICDHAEVSHFDEWDYYEIIRGSARDVKYAQKKYGEKLRILQGIEISDFFWDEEKLPTFYTLCDYDVVLGSVHRVDAVGHPDSFCFTVLTDTPEEEIHQFLQIYFRDIIGIIENFDFDVLTHLTLPLRYINGRYKRGITLSSYNETIDKILKMIIERKIALEVNTSGIDSAYGDFFPDKEIIRRYKNFGGELITIGSDAHTPDRVGYGLKKALDMLKEIGFTHYYYYEKRKPVAVKL